MLPDIPVTATLAIARSFNALVMGAFAWRSYALYRQFRSPLTLAFWRFSLFTCVAYLIYAAYFLTGGKAGSSPLSWGDAIGDPFLFVGTGFIAAFAWSLVANRRSNAPLITFVIAGVYNACLHWLYFAFGVDTRIAILLNYILFFGLTYPIVGFIFIKHGTKRSNPSRYILLGLAFIVASIFGVVENLTASSSLLLLFNILSTLGFVFGFLAILSPRSQAIRA